MNQSSRFRRRRLIVGLAVLATVVLAVSLFRRGSSPTVPPEGVSRPAQDVLPGMGDQFVIESHPQTEHGAVAAAGNYLRLLTALGAMPDLRDTVLDRIVLSEADQLRKHAAAGFALLDSELAAARQTRSDVSWWLRQIPVSFSVDEFTADRARVRVWSLGLAALPGWVESTETWQTTSFDLVWRDGLWRIAGWEVSPGPVPLSTARQPTPTDQLLAGVGTWKEYNGEQAR